MALYKVQSNGKAPAGLQAGDEVVTGGGTYRILGVNADGSYRSALSNRYQTTSSYRGSYGAAGSSQCTQMGTGTEADAALRQARTELNQVTAAKPGSYTSRWEEGLSALYDEITGRKPFSYDLGTDPLYRQYREQYQSAGRTAMEDTMGRAAALTGGYGSSYAQNAGQQAYHAYLQKLNEAVPELYGQARAQYESETAALYDRYTLLQSREQSDYEKYRDRIADYYEELAGARSAYQSAAKLANDTYWNRLNYEAGRQDAANAQYWKQLAYADKQAAAAETANTKQQKAAAKNGQAGMQKTGQSQMLLAGKTGGTKKNKNPRAALR